MKALITGIRGQDGTYLTRELQGQGREVWGFSRTGGSCPGRAGRGKVVAVDYDDPASLWKHLESIQPEEIYHLAAPSCVRDTVEYEREIFALSVDTTLTFLRWMVERSPQTRFFFAGSAEIFGDPVTSPQNEETPTRPAHAYAVAKLAGQELCAAYRRSQNLFASTGILFNHESPRRSADFVTRRITQGVAAIAANEKTGLRLGNLQARRDWTHAADFARAFRLVLEASEPGEFVLASGENHSVREFCEIAFAAAGLTAGDFLREDPALFRPDFTHARRGETAKVGKVLGWKPEIGFQELVEEMVRQDLGGDDTKSA